MPEERQRIDRWLWHARVVRTRSGAASMVAAGYVRINGIRIDVVSHPVKCGDVITITLDRGLRILKVCDFATRRGDATAARRLYAELG